MDDYFIIRKQPLYIRFGLVRSYGSEREIDVRQWKPSTELRNSGVPNQGSVCKLPLQSCFEITAEI